MQEIRENRKIEKTKNREKEAFVLMNAETVEASEIIPSCPTPTVSSATKNPKMLAILKLVQEEKRR